LANITKLAANFLVAASLDIIGQSLALVEKSKLDRQIIMPMLSSFFAPPPLKEYVTRIAERDFDPAGFEIAGGLKDVELMIEAAGEVGLKLTSAEAIRTKIRTAIESGLSGKDWSSFTELDRR
jgi:3-hydroxyisobutyrate dehydrogenase-like beta-hydroxyacid dehydrogenase